MHTMTTFVGASEAARLLGVTKATLYAYVSRGLVERRTAVDGRTSLYSREQLQRIAGERSRNRRPVERPSIDVQIGSAITELSDSTLRYRGHDVVELVESAGFEHVAELLWTGALPDEAPTWPIDRALLDRCRAAIDAAGPSDPTLALALVATLLAGSGGERPTTGAEAARRLLAIAPSVLGGPSRGDVATRLARAWVTRPAPTVVDAIGRALVLLADHELATSTLGVRVACSVRCDPADALATGLHIVRGRLHGAAAANAGDLLADAIELGAPAAVRRRLDAGEQLPGFGHTVYRHGDPRFAPLRAAITRMPGSGDSVTALDGIVAEAGRRIGHLPNIDLALAALIAAADLPRDAPIFAMARLAGWAAHFDEERSERPLRYRGLTTRRRAQPGGSSTDDESGSASPSVSSS
jgi:citrate synthase